MKRNKYLAVLLSNLALADIAGSAAVAVEVPSVSYNRTPEYLAMPTL